MTQNDLALEMGVSQKVISHWEHLGEDKGYHAPRFEVMVQLAECLHEPVAHLIGVMPAHSNTTQSVSEYLGIDPAAVDAIRELSGFTRDGSYEQMLDYSRALSALLIELQPSVLIPFFDLIKASWGVEPVDDPAEASIIHSKSVRSAEEARFRIWSALDARLRESFAVPCENAFATDKARLSEQQHNDKLLQQITEELSDEDLRRRAKYASAFRELMTHRASQFSEEQATIRKRLSTEDRYKHNRSR